MPVIEAAAFWTAKRSNAAHEWEDGFALDEATQRFAIADGASTSTKAAEWAATLTSGFLVDRFAATDAHEFEQWIIRRCTEFAEVHASPLDDEVSADNWLAHAAAAKHGFATFVGVEFIPIDTRQSACRWVGVGDACIFHTRDGDLLAVGPTTDGSDFGLHPDLISSNLEHVGAATDAAFRHEVTVRSGDNVLLISDALAEWALTTSRGDETIWEMLGRLDSSSFERLVEDLRDASTIVNDDVTLIRCEVTA